MADARLHSNRVDSCGVIQHTRTFPFVVYELGSVPSVSQTRHVTAVVSHGTTQSSLCENSCLLVCVVVFLREQFRRFKNTAVHSSSGSHSPSSILKKMHYDLPKRRELLAQQHSVTSQKTNNDL